MRSDVVLRRAVHMMIALAPLYYLIPVDVPYLDVDRWVLLIGFFLVVVMFESVRLWKGFPLFGLRPHEMRSIASFVWAAAGITIALWLFPMDIATVALVGMALVDPLAGELRSRYGQGVVSVALPVAAYFAIAVSILAWFGDTTPFFLVTVGIIGATSAVGAERYKVPRVDDDFLMVVVPCLMMELFSL